MRVTNYITKSLYNRNNERSQTNMLKSYTRIMTQRRFNRVSEDSISGSKAMIIRRQLRDLNIYDDNLSTSKALFSAAEINLNTIAHDIYIKLEEELVSATTGTHTQMELDTFAQHMDHLAEQMVEVMNGDFSERQIFGGTNNSTPPFAIDRVVVEDGDGNIVFPPYFNEYYDRADDGTISKKEGVKFDDIPKTVTYNGMPLDFDAEHGVILPDGTITRLKSGDYTVRVLNDSATIAKTDELWEEPKTITLDFDIAKKTEDNSKLFAGSKPIYVDIGIGIKYNDDYEVDPQTALDTALNGADITGSGIDISGVKFVDGKVPTKTEKLSEADAVLDLRSRIEKANSAINLLSADPASTEARQILKDTVGAEITENPDDGTITVTIDGRNIDLKNDAFSIADDNKISIGGADVTVGGRAGKVLTALENVFVDSNGNKTVIIESDDLDLSGLFSKNLIQLTLDAAAALRKGDQATPNAIIDRANTANNRILTQITTLGAKQNNIEFYQSKIIDYRFNLKERQNLVEGTDMEDEIMNMENLKAAYDAWLKIGTQVIPNSIFDFI